MDENKYYASKFVEEIEDGTSKEIYFRDDEAQKNIQKLNDIVDTKLTQPYVSNDMDVNIVDSDNGLMKNIEIRGKSTQEQRTDIVPIPTNPIPLISKKIRVGNEIVELISLKETDNLWDLNLCIANSLETIEDNNVLINGWATNAISNITKLLKPNKTYSIRVTIEMVEKYNGDYTNELLNKMALLYRDNVEGFENVAITLFDTILNLNNGETTTITNSFTTPNDLTSCNVLWYSENYDNNYSKVRFKDIVLVEGSTQPTSYIAPTVRDYLIVDDTNQTIKVKRNVGYKQFDGSESWMIYVDDSNESYKYGYYIEIDDMKNTSLRENGFANNIEVVTYAREKHLECWLGVNSNLIYVVGLDDNFNTVDKWKTHLNDNNMIVEYPLETPTEETIPYVSGITSQVGLTTQDNMTPSPTIPSPIESVENLEIKVCGKNLFDIGKIVPNNDTETGVINSVNDGVINGQWKTTYESANIGSSSYSSGWIYTKNAPIKLQPNTYTVSFKHKVIKKLTEITNLKNFMLLVLDKEQEEIYQLFFLGDFNVFKDQSCTFTLDEANSIYFVFSCNNCEIEVKDIQIELGTQPTSYETYKEQVLSLELPFSFKSSLDGSIYDYIDVERGKYVQCLKEEIFDGNDENWQPWNALPQYKDKSFSFAIKMNDVPNDSNFNVFSNMFISGGAFPNHPFYTNEKELIGGYYANASNNQFIAVSVFKNRLTGLTSTSFKNYLSENPLTVVYELATPIEYEIPQDTLAQLKQLKTYYDVTNIISNVPIKFDYKLNMPSWYNYVSGVVENAKDIIYDTQIQTIENTINNEYMLMMLEEGML